MRTLSDAAVAALGGDRLVFAGAAKFSIGPGYRFWSGFGPLTISSEPFTGIGAQALIMPISAASGAGADGAQIELSGLDPDVAASIEAEDYAQRPVTIWRLVFNAAGDTLLAAAVFMRGRLDSVTVVESETSVIRFAIEGPRRDMGRRGSRIRSAADQRLLGDGGFRNISVSGRKTLSWGGAPTPGSAVASPGGGGGGSAARPGTVRSV
jgi:hypothetical protein